MGHASWWVMDVVGPALLLIVLIWLVIRVRGSRDNAANRRAEEGTRELYSDEEKRRREGTDKL